MGTSWLMKYPQESAICMGQHSEIIHLHYYYLEPHIYRNQEFITYTHAKQLMLQLEQFHNAIYFHWFLLQQSVVAKNVVFLLPALWKESAAFGSVEMKFLWLLFITDCHCILQRMPCKYNEKIFMKKYCPGSKIYCQGF